MTESGTLASIRIQSSLSAYDMAAFAITHRSRVKASLRSNIAWLASMVVLLFRLI